MTSKELVMRTLEFSKPERVPRQLWLLPWAQNNYQIQLEKIQENFPDDIIHAPGFFEEQPKVSGKAYSKGEYVDEWGCVFVAGQDGVIGEVKNPLIANWQDIDKVRAPQEYLTLKINEVNDFCRQTDKFILASCCPRPFERLQFLRGTENVMMDLALEENEIFKLLDTLHQFFLKELKLWAQTEVDGMIFMDDWGSQRSLLISPDMWRKYFKPLYKEYIDIAHDYGKKVFMHSDGFILDVIDDLIEIGLDALNSQIFCMGIEELARYAGKITFWGELDRQHLLPNGSRQDIINSVKTVYNNLYRDGGVIAQLEFGPSANPDNIITAFETWNSFDLARSM